MYIKKKRVKGMLVKMKLTGLSSALLPIMLLLMVTYPEVVQIINAKSKVDTTRPKLIESATELQVNENERPSGDTSNVQQINISEQHRQISDSNEERVELKLQTSPQSLFNLTLTFDPLTASSRASPLPSNQNVQDVIKMIESSIESKARPPIQQHDILYSSSLNKSSSFPEVTTHEESTTALKKTTTTPTTITRAPTITHGSHYQMLARTESRNLVKLEKISNNSRTAAGAGLDVAATLHDNHKDDELEPESQQLSPSSEAADQSASVLQGWQSSESTGKLRRSLRSSPGETHPSSSWSWQQRATVRALLGQRLVIPCSNLSESSSSSQQPQQTLPASSRRPASSTAAAAAAANQRFRATGGNSQKPQVAAANGQGISLIVWHKDEQLNSPIFAVDARGASSLREAKQQTGSESLRGRVHLEESTRLDSRGLGSTPALVIDEAQAQDAGLYTCTIEFYKAPTQMHVARVELINPPRNLLIRDDSNKVLTAASGGLSLIGPYEEETRLKLTCEVEAGEPPAQLSWWQLESISPLLVASNPHVSLVSAGNAPPLPQQLDTAAADYPQQYNRMTTMTLDSADSEVRDYLVSVLSSTQMAPPVHLQRQTLPYRDGHSLRYWRRVIDYETSSSSNRLQSIIQLSLSRANLWDEFMCCAWSPQFVSLINATVKVDLNLKPESVQIVNKSNHLFKVGQSAVVECHVQGSKPSAKVRWFRGSQELETASLLSAPQNSEYELNQNYISEINRDTNNLTRISLLTLVPQLSDNQQNLTCLAGNPKLPNTAPLSDTIVMSVQFPARLNLQLGANIKADSIQIGHDVILECNVQSNPPIIDLTWLFNGQPLANNISAGIITSNQTLVLQHVSIEQRGQYQCTAQNSMGRSSSNKLELRPKFAPVCDYTLTRTKYEVAVNQPMKVECHVLAEPDDDIHFVWQFNQSSIDRDGEDPSDYRLDDIKQYETNFTRSHVIFTPKTKHNYGRLLCSASNSRGKQEKPCVIQVSPSELPDPVFGCWFDNLTDSSFSVHCQTPHSNATRQNYLIELYTNESSNSDAQHHPAPNNVGATTGSSATHLRQREEGRASSSSEIRVEEDEPLPHEQQQVQKLKSDMPSFNLTDLQPDTSYNILIYVQNSKGRSAPASYQTSTLPLSKSNEPSPAGHVHLSNKRLAMESGFVDRVSGFLKLNEYVPGDKSKVVVVIVIILLLSTFAVIAVVFSILRQCRANTRQKHIRNSQRGSRDLGQTKLSAYDKRTPQLDTTVRLSPADSARMKALAGSGSDTSRETNTDSTLIPSSRTGAELPVDKMSTMVQMHLPRSGSLARFSGPKVNGTAVVNSQQQQQQHYLSSSNNPSPLLMSMNKSTIDQKVHSVYSSLRHQPNTEMELSHTPQVSMKSESDSNSNREVQSAIEDSKAHNQVLTIKCQENINEPVYVISRKGLLTGQCVTPQQIHLIDPTGYWPQGDSLDNHTNNGSISAGTQVSSIGTSDSFDRTNSTAIANTYNLSHCQVLNNSEMHQNEPQLGPVSYLPGSMSIPVSLSSCLHSRNLNNQHHRLSHDLLNGDVCIAGANGSYLTLAPDGQARYQHETTLSNQQPQLAAFSYNASQDHQRLAELSPPASFAANQDHCRGSLNMDDGGANHYCAQTLQHPYRISSKLNGCPSHTPDLRRGSFEDNLIPASYTTQSHKHHVRFDPQNILYDPMTMSSVAGTDPRMVVNKEDLDQY